MHRVRQNFKYLVIITVNVCIAVKIVDVLVGLFLPYVSESWYIEPSARSVTLREMGAPQRVELVPQEKYSKLTDTLPRRSYVVNIDKDGFIVPTQSADDIDGHVDLMFFGGSTTAEVYVDEDKRFPNLSASILSHMLDRTITGLNAGVNGNHSQHSLINLIAKGIKYRPKIAILLHNVNDWSSLSRTGSYWIAPATRAIVQNDPNDPVYTGWRGRTYYFLRDVKDILAPNVWGVLSRLGFDNPFLLLLRDEFLDYPEFKFDADEVAPYFRSSLLSFVRVCRAWEIEPVLMTQASRLTHGTGRIFSITNDQLEKFEKYQREFNRIIRDVASSNGIYLIDLDAKLSNRPEFIYDAVHFNTEGSEAAARIIAESLYGKYRSYLLDDDTRIGQRK